MADTMKTFDVTCPECAEEFEADIPEAALLPNAEAFAIECPECGEESEIVYEPTAQTVTLVDAGIDDDEDEDLDTPLTCEDDEEDEADPA
jgi:ribosomal protein S27E